MYWKHGLALLAAMLVSLSAGALSAQEQQRDQNRAGAAQQREGAAGAQREGAAGAQREGAQREGRGGQQLDQQVALILALGNQEEIQLGQFASQKAQNPQVKEFAQKMVQEHTQYLQKLQQLLPPGQWEELQASTSVGSRTTGAGARTGTQARPNEGAANEDRPGAARTAENQAAAGAQTEGRQPREGRNFAGAQGEQRGGAMLQLHKEAQQLCFEKTKEYMSQKQGREFDQCYIGQQIGAHIGMVALLEAAQKHVSPEFQATIQQGAQSAEQHLKEAQTIAQALEQGGQRGAQPNPPGATRTPPGAQPGQPQP